MPIESLTIAQITEQLASEIQKIAPTLMEYQCNYIASLLVSAGWRKMPEDAEPYTAEELNDMLFTARTTAVRDFLENQYKKYEKLTKEEETKK